MFMKKTQKKEINYSRELKRKAIHIIFGTAFLLLIYFTNIQTSLIILTLSLFVGTIASIAIIKRVTIPFLEKIVENVERENEKKFPGKAAVLFFISAIILLLIFGSNKEITLAALSVQVFADAAGALFGMKFGKHKLIGKKTIEGSTAFFVVALICLSISYPFPTALIAAIVATLIEALPLDDNLWVPLFTAGTLSLISL